MEIPQAVKDAVEDRIVNELDESTVFEYAVTDWALDVLSLLSRTMDIEVSEYALFAYIVKTICDDFEQVN
jgi:hypothetical protein